MRKFYTLIISIAVISWMADGKNIFGFIPLPIENNQRFEQKLFKELAVRRPHEVKFTSLAFLEYPLTLKAVKIMDYLSTMKRKTGLQQRENDKYPGSIFIGEDGLGTLLEEIWFRQLGTKKGKWTFPQNVFYQLVETDRIYISLNITNSQKLFTSLPYRFNASEISFQPKSNRLRAHYLHGNSHDTSYIGHNTVLFITHGELVSLIKVLESGLQAFGIPMAGDQINNRSHLEHFAYGYSLTKTNFTAKTLSWTIHEIFGKPKYHEIEKRSQLLFRDKPETALETPIFWTEYVIRHGNNSLHYLKPARVTTPWYLQEILYIYISIALIILILVNIFLTLLKLLFSMCSCKIKKNNTEDWHERNQI